MFFVWFNLSSGNMVFIVSTPFIAFLGTSSFKLRVQFFSMSRLVPCILMELKGLGVDLTSSFLKFCICQALVLNNIQKKLINKTSTYHITKFRNAWWLSKYESEMSTHLFSSFILDIMFGLKNDYMRLEGSSFRYIN